MKKIKMIFLLLIFSLVSCAVDPPTYYFTKNGYIDEIERIELVEYKNESYKMVDTSKDILKFDPEKVVKVETLNNEKVEDFLGDFENIVFHGENESVNEPTGYCLLWHLKNGNFIVFSCTIIKGDRAYSMVAEFDSAYNYVMHYVGFAARPHFEKVVDDYFEMYSKPVE